MSYRNVIFVTGLCILLKSQLNGAVIFQDDFSNPGTSHLNWVSTNEDFNTRNFDGGVCNVKNTNLDASSYIYHELTTKPSVFTISCKIVRASATVGAGLSVCFKKQDAKNYTVMIGNKTIAIFIPGATSTNLIQCPNLEDNSNLVSISKSGSTFNVFVNNKFITSFSDNQIDAGDIAFVSRPNTSVAFDDVVMTDQFMTGAKDTCYSDNFDNAALSYWSKIIEKGTALVANGKLRMETENNDSAYCFMLTELELTNFVARVEVSHRGGNINSIYGMRISGKDPNNSASFVINGGRKFGSGLAGAAISMASHQNVRGAAITVSGQQYFYIDTLEIVKKNGSGNYLFVINSDTLDTLEGVTFPVTNVGFFCQDSLNLEFDNFIASEGDRAYCPLAPVIISGKRIRTPQLLSNSGCSGVYDMLGRNVFTTKQGYLLREKSAAKGLYIDSKVKEKVLLNK